MRVRSLSPAVVAAALLLGGPARAFAQEPAASESSKPQATRLLSIGAGFAGGSSMLLDPAENWKVSPVFAWRLTVDANYPFNDVVAAALSLGLDRRGGEFYWYDDKTVTERRMVNYFTITPGVNLKGFVLGLNIGVPMGGSRTYRNGDESVERTVELDAKVDKLLVLIEPRLSGMIPVLDTELGWLGVTVGAGYALSDMSERLDFSPGETPGKTFSTASASAHIGLTWQFGIPGTRR
jgi:hypothetical protein